MSEIKQFEPLIDFYINALLTVLGRTLHEKGPAQAAALRFLKETIIRGARQDTDELLDSLGVQSELSDKLRQALFVRISRLSTLSPALLNAVVQPEVPAALIRELYGLGLLIEEIGFKDMAYNLYESAYHLAFFFQEPCLETAKKLRNLSNPENIDQYHAAIWRLATAWLTDSINSYKSQDSGSAHLADDSAWLAVLDSVELALNVYTESIPLQQQLCDQFVLALRAAEGTPIGELIAIYPTQVDDRFISPEMRRKMIGALAGRALESGDSESVVAATALWAAAKGQTMLDDARLKLLGRYSGNPSLSWHSLTLRHRNLLHAIPLQRALIVDVKRTGPFILELTHEVAHACCLLGPLGLVINAFRAAVHSWEIFFGASDRASRGDDGLIEIQGVSGLADLAEIQLAASYRSAVHEATWTCWLEGVAQYVELLADPKKDTSEILGVHEAVRSLVDFSIAPHDGESQEEFSRRYGEESASLFEDFVSAAQSSLSRLKQIDYLKENSRREIYLYGYLLVRSVVARWETTLGRRIEPVHAVRLLLNASSYGTHSVDWGFQVAPEDFASHAAAAFEKWIDTIAAIDRDSLAVFFQSVGSGERGHDYHWVDGRPRRVTTATEEFRLDSQLSWTSFEQACVELMSGKGLRQSEDISSFADGVASANRDGISSLFSHYFETLRLLPVGKDMSRLVLFNSGRAMVCPRTYIGLEKPTHDDALPRYSVRDFPLEGGFEEVSALRRICGLLGTARLHVTRIIDLYGHPNSPDQRRNMSYVCLFLEDQWYRVTIGDTHSSYGITDEFVQALRARVLHPLFPNEEETLASPVVLARRLVAVKPESHYGNLALAFDRDSLSRSVALRAVARAFESPDDKVREATSDTLGPIRSRIDLADYLYSTGMGCSVSDHPALKSSLGSMVLSFEHTSGIKPFGGFSWLS